MKDTNPPKFEYGQKVVFKAKEEQNKSFYEGKKGFVIAMETRSLPSESLKLYRYLVQIDDRFEYREWQKEADLEAV